MPFRDIIGHRALVALMVRAIDRDTLPPSLVFAGPAGVGKATTAVALALRLNCDQPVAVAFEDGVGARDACGTCAACRKLMRAAEAFREGRERPAIDCLHWLEPDEKGSIKIEPVREMLARAGFRPFDGRVRVVVLDCAHELEIPAQQALLKMLEEPPSATRFVLVTAQPDALLSTIRSRCPQLRFGPLSAAEVAGALVQRFGWPAEEAQAAAALADGRLGRALGRDESTLARAREVAAGVLGHVATSRGPVARLAAAQALIARVELPKGRGEGRGKSAAASRQDISVRLDAMAGLLRDIGVLTTRADQRCLANADLSAQLEELAPAFRGDRLVRAFTVVGQARAALERNASQKVVADWLVLNL